MATTQNLVAYENNDEEWALYATRSATPEELAADPNTPVLPLDLTGLDLVVIIKPSKADDDADGQVLTPTAIDAVNGIAKLATSAAINGVLTSRFYRYDTLDGTKRHTVMYGDYTVTDV